MKFSWLKSTGLLILLTVFSGDCVAVRSTETIQKKLAALEATFDGRVGVFALDTKDRRHIEYRALERFPLQSTFKVMVVAALLKQSMKDPHLLEQKITVTHKDLVPWSPITEKTINKNMTIAELCAAAIRYTDNTATNLLMKKLGGPSAVTAFARTIGDKTFEFESWEPQLNSDPHDRHDSSTPKAMVESLHKLAFGDVLGAAERQQLIAWMKGNTTGDKRIRAGVPKGWMVADKTGSSNDYGIANDIAILWPSQSSSPIILAIYTVRNKKDAPRGDEVIAAMTRLLINEF